MPLGTSRFSSLDLFRSIQESRYGENEVCTQHSRKGSAGCEPRSAPYF